ncbi:hypothetical protein POM88_005464 [Heracleum sosnowskyi]|uniref:Uncharacterized protein n=1 Tax=Heracleum sosnowskyi TaxID=360622 RepID=A0AAD8J1I0_9APIA|nr:hypothetical protein POM88_005464 [Heracleum sosnowskyi]
MSNRVLKQKKKVEDSTNNSRQAVAFDRKKLDLGIWSIKPITLKVNLGSEELQEEYNDKYVCIFMLSLSSAHVKSTLLDTIMLREVHHQIESSGGKFKVICVPTHFQAEFERKHLECDEIYNPYQEYWTLEKYTSFLDIHIDNHTCLKQIASTIGLSKDEDTTHVILGPTKGSCRKVVSIFDSDFLKPDRDFVISNDCTKVPISELQHKTVCLLFYEDHLECRKRIEELKQVYELRKDFEVVVVFPVSFGQRAVIHPVKCNKWRRELEFWKVFGKMPWLAVPFEDPKCRQLWRVFMRTKKCNDCNAPKLLIIYSKEKYFEENGFQVLKETRFTNYPFRGEEVVPSAVAIRGKKLSSVLEPNIELLRARDLDDDKGEPVEFKVSRLIGVSVVFLFVRASEFNEFLSRLQFYHLLSSWAIEKFEVVYIPMIESAPDIASHWMLTTSSAESKEKHLIPLFHHFFDGELTQNTEKEFTVALVTFDLFGHYFGQGISYSNSYEAAYKLFLNKFPFMHDGDKETFESLCSATRIE